MPRSMTAYARATGSSPFGRLVIELHSINRKGLDLVLHIPKELTCFDIDLRKQCAHILERGQVTLRLFLYREGIMRNEITPLLEELKALKTTWEKIAEGLHIHKTQVEQLPFLVSQLQPVAFALTNEQETNAMKEALYAVLKNALEALVCMKEEEGAHLIQDIQKRLLTFDAARQKIAEKKEEHIHGIRQKLHDRVREFATLNADAEARIEREVILLAEKMDITEELVRLESLRKQMQDRLLSRECAVGKAMDFLVQEMLRETHTLGVKAAEAGVSSFVVEMKSALEKVREQVQNIE